MHTKLRSGWDGEAPRYGTPCHYYVGRGNRARDAVELLGSPRVDTIGRGPLTFCLLGIPRWESQTFDRTGD